MRLPLWSNIFHCASHFQVVEQQSVALVFGLPWLVGISIFVCCSSTLDHVLCDCLVHPCTSDNSLLDQRICHQKESVALFVSSFHGFDSATDVSTPVRSNVSVIEGPCSIVDLHLHFLLLLRQRLPLLVWLLVWHMDQLVACWSNDPLFVSLSMMEFDFNTLRSLQFK